MKQKVLAIAGCIAATAPSASIADVLPDKFVGLNLGEIRSISFLNQPFKGVIPFLFTNYENTKHLEINLAPQSIFQKVGAEKHPILNNLNFQVIKQNNKPVILISSDKPINLPFLNFILEIKGPSSTVYQDYTVLLDPASKNQDIASNSHYIDTKNDIETKSLYKKYQETVTNKNTQIERTLKESGTLLLASLASETSTSNQKLKYTVKRGDSLSKIAQQQKIKNASLKLVSKLIYQKNPKAFIRGNVNRLKRGAVLNLPTAAEVNGFEIAKKKPVESNTPKLSKKVSKSNTSITKTLSVKAKDKNTYTVVKGDSLSKITKKFTSKDVPFTKLMNTIYHNNPTAFINQSKNKLKAGATLHIPAVSELNVQPKQEIVKAEKTKRPVSNSKTVTPKTVPITPVTLKPNQYRVGQQDTLTSITNKIGYKDVPFATMLKGIYDHNPDAFKEGRMTSLNTGAIITLPPIDLFQQNAKQSKKIASNKIVTKSQNIKKPVPVSISNKNNNQVVKTDLTKRIRELRNELRQAKESLSGLKSNLSNKELLLQQKNMQLKSLNTMLTKYDKAIDSETLAAIAIKTKTERILLEKEDDYKPKSKAEMAKLKRDLFNRSEKTKKQIIKLEALKNEAAKINTTKTSSKNTSSFKDYKFSSILDSSNTKYAYLILALLLGLLLIRYRRALYSYTYSKINYGGPKYYPVPDADKYDLKEKNISFHDPIMDEDPSNYELVNEEKEENSVTISPHLIDATEEIFETNEEAKQIAHCEHLVTELFDDLDTRDDLEKESEWNDIEKFCDSYIEKIKDNEITNTITDTKDNAVVEEAADFNIMMTDLLDSLEKVDKSMKRNSIINEEFPDVATNLSKKPSEEHPSF